MNRLTVIAVLTATLALVSCSDEQQQAAETEIKAATDAVEQAAEQAGEAIDGAVDNALEGADEIIDYHAVDFTEVVSDCDAVFDTVGGDVGLKAFDVLKPGGRAAFIASGAKAPEAPRDDVQSLRPSVGRARHYMERIAELYNAGVVTVPEITLFDLKDAAEAQKISQTRHLRGKLILKIR